MSQNYNPKVSTNGLVFAFDGTQGFKGANQVRRPVDYGGCALWLDASDEGTIITSGNNVTNWLDKSGNNNDAEVHSTLYPQYDGTTVSNKKAVDFVPTSLSAGDTMKGSFSASGSNQPGQSGGYSSFIIFKQRKFAGTGTSEYAGIMEMAQGAFGSGGYGVRTIIQSFGAGYDTNKIRIARVAAGANIDASWSGGANNGYRANSNITLISNVHNNGTSAQAWCNGYRGGNTATADSTTYTHYCLGDDMTAGDAFNGQICEVIIYNKVLSNTERMAVEFYLARKWDVANYALGRESYERVPVDLTNNASIDTSVGSFTQFAPGIQPGRGIVYQNDSGRRLYFNNQAATANIGTTGAIDEMSIEFAAANIAQKDSGTNYEIISNESYQTNGFIVRYGGNAYGRLHIRTSQSSASTSLDVDTADRTVSGEWAIWQIIWQAGGSSGSYACTCKVYKNGVNVKQSSNFNPPVNTTNDLGAPFGGSSQAFCGELAYLRCYNRALSEEELLDNYLSMKQRIDAIPKIAAPTNVALYLDAHQYGRHQGTTVWYDMSPNEYDVTVTGPTMVNYFPKCYSFDGTDDGGYMTRATSVSASQTNMSYGFWINFDSWVTNHLYNQIYCEEAGVWIANYYDKIGFDIHNGSTWVDTNGGVNDGLQITVPSAKQTATWIYIVLVYDGSGSSTSANFRGYLDGEESFNVTTSFSAGGAGNINASAGDIEIGKRAAGGNDKFLPADLANVMVYQTSLTAAQVKQNYNYFKNRFGH